MSSGRLPLDSSHGKLIDQRHLRDTARTKIQPSVAWAKPKGKRVWGGGGGEGGWVKLDKLKKKNR